MVKAVSKTKLVGGADGATEFLLCRLFIHVPSTLAQCARLLQIRPQSGHAAILLHCWSCWHDDCLRAKLRTVRATSLPPGGWRHGHLHGVLLTR